jgi:putative ABC transport system permease protein
MVFEAGILAALGVVAGTLTTYLILFVSQPILERHFGLFVQIRALGGWELSILAAIIASALIMGLFPALRAYRNTLNDGLQMRV